MFKKNLLLLLILFAVSFSLRIYKIDIAPLGTHPDEASLGYNAYSILETGKDEHGVSYPLIFQAFGDQKLPTYVYLLVPFIKIFGMNNLAVRLPSAIIGSLLTVAIFFLLMQFKFSKKLSFIGAMITAISPWTIILSRVFGYDSNLGLLFFVLGILFFFQTHKNKKFLYLSFIAFGLTWYSYIAYRLITPLILLSLVAIFMRTKKFVKSQAIILLVGFLITVGPLIFLSFSGDGTARFSQVISNPNLGMVLEIDESRSICAQNLPKILCYINANKLKSYSRTVLFRYIKVFSPNYLFLEGDKDSKFLNIDNYGLFDFIFYPFYLVAIIYFGNNFIKRSLNKKELFVIAGLLITPLSAVLVNEPQKIRLSGLFPFLIIFLMYGVSQTYHYLKKFINKKTYHALMIITIIASGFFFMINFLAIHIHKYDIIYQDHNTKLMQYLGQQDEKTQIYINPLTEGIILYSYINKIDPKIFQKSVVRQKSDNIKFIHATELENIHITSDTIQQVYRSTKDKNFNTLYVSDNNLISLGEVSEGKAKKIIYSENGVHALKFVYDLKDIIKEN